MFKRSFGDEAQTQWRRCNEQYIFNSFSRNKGHWTKTAEMHVSAFGKILT